MNSKRILTGSLLVLSAIATVGFITLDIYHPDADIHIAIVGCTIALCISGYLVLIRVSHSIYQLLFC